MQEMVIGQFYKFFKIKKGIKGIVDNDIITVYDFLSQNFLKIHVNEILFLTNFDKTYNFFVYKGNLIKISNSHYFFKILKK